MDLQKSSSMIWVDVIETLEFYRIELPAGFRFPNVDERGMEDKRRMVEEVVDALMDHVAARGS